MRFQKKNFCISLVHPLLYTYFPGKKKNRSKSQKTTSADKTASIWVVWIKFSFFVPYQFSFDILRIVWMKNKYKIKRDGGWEGVEEEEEGLKICQKVEWDATDEEYRFVCDSWIYNFIKNWYEVGKTVKAGGCFFFFFIFLVQVQSSQTFGYSGQI